MPDGFTFEEAMKPAQSAGFTFEEAMKPAARTREPEANPAFSSETLPGPSFDFPGAAQTQPGADLNAIGQGLVSGIGGAIAGAGRAFTAAGAQGTQRQLAVMDAIDAGKEVPQDQDVIGYQFLSPEQRKKVRSDFMAADAELSKREPNSLVRVGTAISGAAPEAFPVSPEAEGIQTGAARLIGGVAPAIAAGASGGPVGVLASMAAIGTQAYEGTYQDAIAKGASPEEAENAAGKSAMAQAVTQVVPIGRLIQRVPVPLRDGLMKTLFNLGQHGVELGGANAVGTFANNYVAQQTYDPGRSLTQGIGDAALEGAIAGLVIRGAAMGVQGARAAAGGTTPPSASEALAAIGKAPNVDGAIAAASEAVKAPVRETGLVPPAVGPVGDLGLVRNPDGTVGTPGGGFPPLGQAEPRPQSLSAAATAGASRDMSVPGSIPEVTPAQKATALQKMVTQSAEDRLTPQGRDDAVYVEGVERPEAMRDFLQAAEGGTSAALQHKVLYNTDTNYHDQFDALVKKNNAVMVDKLGELFGDANARDAAMNDAKDLMPGPIGLFDNQAPVDAQPIVDKIHEIMSGPAGKRGSVESTLKSILPKLYDAEGNLETLPSMLKGVRDDITDRLYDKTPTTEGNAARTARNQLNEVLQVVDEAIASGLPGTKYRDYLDNLSAALGHVSKLDYLQKFLTGPRKLTDLAGNLQFSKVQKMLDDIQAHHADRTGGAKELSMDDIHQIEAVRNELAAKDLLDRRASVRGSPTAQLTNASGLLGSGPLGTAVKGAGELALHSVLLKTTGGIGNAALLGHKYAIKPMLEKRAEQKAAAELEATKQRLLDTTSRDPDLGGMTQLQREQAAIAAMRSQAQQARTPGS